MSIRQVAPHPVFPSGDSRDLAELRFSPDELTARRGLHFTERQDDLDAFKLAAIELADGVQAWFIKYRGDQYPGTLVRVDAAADPGMTKRQLVQALDLRDEDFSWVAPSLVTTPAAP